MISRKFLNKVTWILTGVLVLVIVGLTIYQRHLIKVASQNAALESAAKKQSETRKETAAERDQRISEDKQRDDLEEKLLGSSSIKQALQASLKKQYVPFFKELNLSPDMQEKMESMLEESAMESMSIQTEARIVTTKDQKTVLQQRYDTLRKETNLKAEGILGSDNYKKYLAYENRSIPRKVVSGFGQSLGADEKLSEDQTRKLIEIMYEESEKVYSEIGYDPTNLLDFPSDMDTETLAKRMEITNRVLNNSADSSKDILSESQLEKYREYLKDYSTNEEKSLFMLWQQYGQ